VKYFVNIDIKSCSITETIFIGNASDDNDDLDIWLLVE